MFLRIGLTALCAALSLSVSARDISLVETVTTKSISSVAVSADGEVAAFTKVTPRTPYVDEDGSNFVELYVVRGESDPVPFITDKQGISNVSIHGDAVYFTSKRDDDEHTSLYKISLNGGEAQQVFAHANSIYDYALSADGRYLSFTARTEADKKEKELAKKGFKAEVYEEENEFTHAWFVDLSAESRIAVQLTDDRHVYSVAFRPNQEQLLLRTAPTPLVDDNYMSSQYELISFAGVQESSFNTVGKLGKAEFSPDGRYLAVIAAADYNDPASGRLLVFDLQNDNTVRDVLPDYPGHVQDIDWRDNDELIYLGHIGTESEVHAITMQWLETRPLLEAGEAIVVDIEATVGQSAVYARAHRPEHPTELFRLQMQNLIRLTDSNPWLAEITMPKQETIRYKARDGLELEGILVYPTDYQEESSYPLITVVHGGPESHYSNGWLDRYSSPVKHAAQQGYALFFPNYRGSTGRGVEFSKLGQNDYAGKEFDDIVDGKTHLVERGIVDGERAVLPVVPMAASLLRGAQRRKPNTGPQALCLLVSAIIFLNLVPPISRKKCTPCMPAVTRGKNGSGISNAAQSTTRKKLARQF